jgi:hypothetical protein
VPKTKKKKSDSPFDFKLKVEDFRWEVTKALQDVCDQVGVECGTVRIQSSETEGQLVFSFNRLMTQAEKDERRNYVPKIGTKFMIRNRMFEVTGYNGRNNKYKVLAERCGDRRKFKVTWKSVIDGHVSEGTGQPITRFPPRKR